MIIPNIIWYILSTEVKLLSQQLKISINVKEKQIIL